MGRLLLWILNAVARLAVGFWPAVWGLLVYSRLS